MSSTTRARRWLAAHRLTRWCHVDGAGPVFYLAPGPTPRRRIMYEYPNLVALAQHLGWPHHPRAELVHDSHRT